MKLKELIGNGLIADDEEIVICDLYNRQDIVTCIDRIATTRDYLLFTGPVGYFAERHSNDNKLMNRKVESVCSRFDWASRTPFVLIYLDDIQETAKEL